MNWTGKQVLVTGAGGFIGSHLTERLVGLGAEVRALVRYTSMNRWGWLDALSPAVLADIEVIPGDVRDPQSLLPVMRGADVVFHLAALIAIPYSYVSPAAYVRTNVEGTLNVLQAALEAGVGRLVHTSTSEVYGTAQYVPMDEAHPLRAQSPYAASKIGADQIADSYCRSFSLPICIVRPFNTFGPRQSARAIVPAIATQLLADGGHGQVRLGSLHPRRDFTYVDDVVEGFLLAAEAPGALGQVINLGTGVEVSVAQLVHQLARLVGREVVPVTDPERVRPEASEVDRLCADAQRARDILGWEPRVGLEEGLGRTVEWLKRNLDLYRADQYTL